MFVGIITRSTEFGVTSSEGLYKCTRMQKAPEDSAYDPKCVEYELQRRAVHPGRSELHRRQGQDAG